MKPKLIRLTLKSAATFGRGDGVAGLVDVEIEHDIHGFPFMRGKTLKGLLKESAENVVHALKLQQNNQAEWEKIKDNLFGTGGRGLEEQGNLHIGDACLPHGLQTLLKYEIQKKRMTPEDILNSLTGIRRQTAINSGGAPDRTSLRSMRVLLKHTILESRLFFKKEPSQEELSILVASVMDFRRAGTGRNRGRGWLHAELDDEGTTRNLFETFAKAVNS